MPFFIITPRNQTVKRGSNVVLEAFIDGNPVPDVYLNGSNSNEIWHLIPHNQTVYQHTIFNIQLNSSTSYTFSVISNIPYESIFATIFLTVIGMH